MTPKLILFSPSNTKKRKHSEINIQYKFAIHIALKTKLVRTSNTHKEGTKNRNNNYRQGISSKHPGNS